MTPHKPLLALLALGLGALASAQNLTYYFNVAGSDASLRPSTITVSANSPVTLSVYAVADAPLEVGGFGGFLTYTTSTSGTGLGAVPTANGLTFASATFAPAFAPFGLGTVQGGSTDGEYGAESDAISFGGMLGTFTPTPTRLYNITLNVGNLANGETRPLALDVTPGATTFTSFAIRDSDSSYVYPARFASTLQVGAPVPEPATMAALGLGALALLRRRRAMR